MYGTDVNGYLTDLGIVVGGLDGTRRIVANDPNDPYGEYYVGYDAFDPSFTGQTTGFDSTYNPNNQNQVRHFLAGASGSENYGGLAETFMLATETEPFDDALYGQAFDFVDYLNGSNPLSDAGDWVLNNLQ